MLCSSPGGTACPFILETHMSGTNISSVNLDPRRRRALFHSWHRGMREMDLLMGRFADAELAKLSDADLDDYEILIQLDDRDIFGWLTGKMDIPSAYDTPVFRKLLAFHTHTGPVAL